MLLLRGLICPLFSDEPLQLPLFYEGLDLLLQIVTIGCVMAVVSMEAAILILRAPIWVPLQLSGVGQGFLILDLHQDLVYRGR